MADDGWQEFENRKPPGYNPRNRLSRAQVDWMREQYNKLRAELPGDETFDFYRYLVRAEQCYGTFGYWICVFAGCINRFELDDKGRYPETFVCEKCENKKTMQETRFKYGF